MHGQKSLTPFLVFATLFVLTFLIAEGLPSETPGPVPVVIQDAQVWDGTGRSVIKNAFIVIEGDRIKSVGTSRVIPKNARIFRASGKNVVIPGLITAHGHVGMTKGLKAGPENYSEENVRSQLRQYARYGVATVMSLGTDLESMFKIRGVVRPDEPVRATVLTAGRGFTGKNGYPAVLPGNAGVPREVDSVEEIRRHIGELAAQRVDMVKIWMDDHWGHYNKIRPELAVAVIEEAHKKNLRVMAHIFYLDDAKKLVAAGLDGLAHSVRDKEVDEELIRLMKEKNTFVVPTLTREESTFIYAEPPPFLDDPFFSRQVSAEIIQALKDPAYGKRIKSDPDFPKYAGQLRMAQRNLKKLSDAGIKIAFGTDTGPPGRFQGYFEHRELELMVEAGLTSEQALLAATRDAAQALHIDRDTGTLEAGKRADLLMLDADPLQNILNTRKIRQIWIAGREVY
ncbi:MAG TPA: amidohydrolase family protein [Acidobacteriota bacterium]